MISHTGRLSVHIPSYRSQMNKQKNDQFFINKSLPPNVERWLNIMLRYKFKGRDELISHLKLIKIDSVIKEAGYMLIKFKEPKGTEKLSLENFLMNTTVIDIMVFTKGEYETNFLLYNNDYVSRLEIYNVASEAYLELENFENIQFYNFDENKYE